MSTAASAQRVIGGMRWISHRHPDVANLHLPPERTAVVIRLAGAGWLSGYEWEGVGLVCDSQPPPPYFNMTGRDVSTLYVWLWRQRLRPTGSSIYLEYYSHPEPDCILRGLLSNPPQKLVNHVNAARTLLMPDAISKRGPKPGKGYHQVFPWEYVVAEWCKLVDEALYNGDPPSKQELARRLGMNPSTFYRNYSDEQQAELAAIEHQLRQAYSRPK